MLLIMQCGICQKDMFGVVETPDGLTICGSCVLAPLPPPTEGPLDSDYDVDSGFDLSYLEQEGQRDAVRNTLKKGTSRTQVQMNMGKMALQLPVPLQEEPSVTKLKLKSNSIRDRMHPIGKLMLRFDGEGVARFPEHQLDEIQAHMRLRPGRFHIIEDMQAKEAAKGAREALDAARVALVAARAEPEPKKIEPILEPVQEPEMPEMVVVPMEKLPAPKAKPKSRARKGTTRSPRKKKEV